MPSMRSPKMLDSESAARHSTGLMRPLSAMGCNAGWEKTKILGILAGLLRFPVILATQRPTLVPLQSGPRTTEATPDTEAAKSAEYIRVRGARTHNLKNI